MQTALIVQPIVTVAMSLSPMDEPDVALFTDYVEITRKPRKPKQRRSINWLDLPLVYGQQGFEMKLSGSDKATLAYLYGNAIKFHRIDDGGRYKVTMTTGTVEG